MTHNEPRIAVIPAYSDDRKIRISPSFLLAVYACGATPTVLPFTESEALVSHFAESFDGFLFSGGLDVDPIHYGEEITGAGVEIDPERDRFELLLMKHIKSTDKPILGVCRGAQLMNVAFGGSLVQDMSGHRQAELNHVPAHTVSITEGSLLASAVGRETVSVNSYHHQAVKSVAPTLTVSAYAPDGTIEAIEGRGERFLLGVQWHPELMLGGDGHAERIFSAFVDAARK